MIELLVAMAIIGILIALALYGISIAQRNSRDTDRKTMLGYINSAASDLYANSGKQADQMVFSATGVKIITSDEGPAITDAECAASNDCMFQAIEGPSLASQYTALQTGGMTGDTDNAHTKYYFDYSGTSGYLLGICLETGKIFNASTAAEDVTSAELTCN